MADDPMLREMTSDPRLRKVLVTDGMTAVGQALVREFAKAGAELIWVGHAEPWKQHGSGLDAIAALPQVTLLPLDLTDGRSVQALAGEIGGKVDIVVNNAEVHRAFSISARRGTDVAKLEMEVNYFGALAAGAGLWSGVGGPQCRWRGQRMRVGQPVVDLCTGELSAARHLFGQQGGGALAGAVPARRASRRGHPCRQRVPGADR